MTIEQVARSAGVSRQTVSRVVNNHPSVAPNTRLRVQRVIGRMGYQPNVLARSLVHRRSHTLGVVATGLEYYGPSTTLIGIEERATELGYSIVLSLVHRPQVHDVAQVLNGLLSRQVDGVIWAVPEIGENRTWLQQRTPSLPVPVVFLSMHRAEALPVVSVENYAGAQMAVEHLLAQGYRKIGLITGPLDWWEARERKRGWEDSLRDGGLPIEGRAVFEGDWSASSGERGYEELAVRYPDMDALFACNDQMALGVLQACYRKGRRVPDELGLVGFDDIPESAYFWPPLTTVRQELRALGGRGVEKVSQMIAAIRGEAPSASQEEAWLMPRLVVRGSAVARRELLVPPSSRASGPREEER